MNFLKNVAHDWLPPALVRRVQYSRRGGIRFEGDFPSWEEAGSHSTGYDADDILAKVLNATPKVSRGEAAFERDSVLFDQVEYAWPALSGLLWVAARNSGRLNVLDFGGALGSSYFQNRKFLQTLPDVCWNVVEQAHYVEAGRTNIQSEHLRFFNSIEECLLFTRPNVILLSSVLQYLKAPFDILETLSSIDVDAMIIDRTPFSTNRNNRLMIQRVPPSIYTATYPMWVFSQSHFMKMLSAHWHLIASNLSPEGHVYSKNGFNFSFQGMLLESRR